MIEVRRRARRTRRRLRRGRRRIHARWQSFRRSPAGRRVRWGLVGVAALVLLGAVWILITGLLARRQLSALQLQLQTVQRSVSQGDLAGATAEAGRLPGMAERAHRLTSGPAWWVGASVPYLGEPLDVARGSTDAGEQLASGAVPQLIDVVRKIDPATLRVKGDTVRLTPLMQATPELHRAAGSLAAAAATLRALPGDTWFGAVDNGRATLLSRIDTINGYVAAADRATRVLPEMLGADGRTRRYFIGLQNEAELRGTGGIPGAPAIATTRNGTVTFTRFASDAALLPNVNDNRIATGLDFGRTYDSLYGAGNPTEEFNDSNVSPSFPYAARIWAAMWQKQYYQHIDGALALDPTTLSYFLQATGPATIPGRGSLTAENVVSLTQRDNYALFSDNTERRAFLVSILKAASTKLTSGAGSPVALAQAASRAAAQRRLLVWSSDAATERLLEQTTYAGDIAADGAPLSALILNNAAAGKLDFYLQRSVDYRRSGCGPTRDVTVGITLTNNAPPGNQLPYYVTLRLDKDKPKTAQVGDSRVVADYWATGGAQLVSATMDGKPVTANITSFLGRTVFRFDVELPRGQAQTIELHLTEPAGRGAPTVWEQPGVTPVDLQVSDQGCSG